MKPPLKNEMYRPLLERREELKNEINKLMCEYKAIGDLINDHIKLKEEKDRESEEQQHK